MLADASTQRGCRCTRAAQKRVTVMRGAFVRPRAWRSRSFVNLITVCVEKATESVDEAAPRTIREIALRRPSPREGPSRPSVSKHPRAHHGRAETVADELGEVGSVRSIISLQRIRSSWPAPTISRDADAVTLMSLHNAKGLGCIRSCS
jgi:hypothetical protein